MSEGHGPAETTPDQRQLTRHDINLLSQVVLRAQDDPLSTTSPKDALINAYDDVVAESHVHSQDTACISILLKILAPDAPAGNLFTKFEAVLRDQGIELSFDDDTSSRDSAASVSNEVPATEPNSELQVSGTEHVNVAVTQTSADPDVPEDNLDDLDDYMDNPPPQIAQLMQVAEAMDRRTLMRQSLAILRTRNISRMERQADNYYERNLLFRALSQWSNVAAEQQMDSAQADEYYNDQLRQRYLRRLSDASRVQRIQAMDQERLKGLAMYKMTIAAREMQFTRNMEVKLKWKFLGVLVEAYRADQSQQRDLDIALNQQQAKSDLNLVQPIIKALKHQAQQLKVMNANAEQHYNTKVTSDAVQQWRNKLHQQHEKELMADDLREYFLMRKYVLRIRDAAQARYNRRTVLGRWVLKRWRSFLDIKKHQTYDLNYKLARRAMKMNLARRQLQIMASEAARIKELERVAEECCVKRTRKIAHNAVVAMYNKSQKMQQFNQVADNNADRLALKHAVGTVSQRSNEVHQMDQVADRYQTLHTQRVAVTCFKQLSMKSFEIQRRQQDADAFRGRHDKKLVRIMLDKMRVAGAESRGEGPLRLPPATPSQKRAEELMRLSSTTPRYTPSTTATRGPSFAARLRGEAGGFGGGGGGRQVAERIAEEVEGEEEGETD